MQILYKNKYNQEIFEAYQSKINELKQKMNTYLESQDSAYDS